MNEEQKKWDVVPFDTFEQYLGPRYENVPGVEYILENGTLLYFMEEAPGVYESADHTVTGATDKPKLYVPVYDGDELQPSSLRRSVPVSSLRLSRISQYNGPARCESAAGTGLCVGQWPCTAGK